MEPILKTRDLFDIDNMIEINMNDFISFPIGINNLEDSNIFLNNLWLIFDLNISPLDSEKCPWFYIPDKIILKNKNITFLGSIRTKFGFIYIAVSYKKKGTLQELLLFSFNIDLSKPNIKKYFNELIKGTKKISTQKYIYSFKCTFDIKNNYMNNLLNQKFKRYSGINFIILNKSLYINIETFGIYNAENIVFEKISKILSFLSIETNCLFEIKEIIPLKNNPLLKNIHKEFNPFYQEEYYKNNESSENGNFIDFIPIDKKNNTLLLSNSACLFIDFILKSDLSENNKLKYFLNGCKHFSSGLKEQLNESLYLTEVGKEIYITVSSKKIDNSILNNSITYYLSAIETISLNNHKKNTCPHCNQAIYQINQRVFDYIVEYLWPHSGEIFKKIYNLRSKYLHAGETNISNFRTNTTRPLLDINTATGSIDYSISLNISNQTTSFGVENIKEWTSYSFRNFYKKNFINIQE